MKYSNVGAGVLGTAAVGLLASLAFAGPLERDATSKALGDFSGRGITRQAVPYQNNRAFSYEPQVAAPTAPAPAEVAQPNAAVAQSQDNSTRSFSYQAAPQMGNAQVNRASARIPRYTHAELKAHGEY